MELRRIDPPRRFDVGERGSMIAHVADVDLEANEQLTFVTASGTEHDVVRKSWGYYATPSLNGRLREHGLRAALCVGVPRAGDAAARMYLLLVEPGSEDDFEEYLEGAGMRVAAWLDSDEAVGEAARRLEEERS